MGGGISIVGTGRPGVGGTGVWTIGGDDAVGPGVAVGGVALDGGEADGAVGGAADGLAPGVAVAVLAAGVGDGGCGSGLQLATRAAKTMTAAAPVIARRPRPMRRRRASLCMSVGHCTGSGPPGIPAGRSRASV